MPDIMPIAAACKIAEKYSEKQMVSFGNFMRSKLRDYYHTSELKKLHPETFNSVWDNDLANWKHFTNSGKKEIDFNKILKIINSK